jgi:hypothetical protein
MDMYNELSRRRPKQMSNVENPKQLNTDVNYNMEELIANSTMKNPNAPDVGGRHKDQGINSFDTRVVKFYDGNKAYDVEFSIGILDSGEKVAYAKKYFGYDDALTKKIQTAETRSEQSSLNQPSAFDNSVSQTEQKSTKKSQQDNMQASLSDPNRAIAPTKNGIYAEDVALERPIGPVREDHSGEVTEMVQERQIAPSVTEAQVENDIYEEMYAPVTEEEAHAMIDSDENWERMRSLQEADEPQEIESPAYDDDVQVNDPFEERDIKEVGKRNVNAYMYDNPEVKPFYQEEARIMLGELQNTVKGERF